PDEDLRPREDERSRRPVLPLGDERVLCDERADVVEEVGPRRPAGAVVERVELGVRQPQARAEPAREGRLARSRDPGHGDPPRHVPEARDDVVVRSEAEHRTTVPRWWCREKANSAAARTGPGRDRLASPTGRQPTGWTQGEGAGGATTGGRSRQLGALGTNRPSQFTVPGSQGLSDVPSLPPRSVSVNSVPPSGKVKAPQLLTPAQPTLRASTFSNDAPPRTRALTTDVPVPSTRTSVNATPSIATSSFTPQSETSMIALYVLSR